MQNINQLDWLLFMQNLKKSSSKNYLKDGPKSLLRSSVFNSVQSLIGNHLPHIKTRSTYTSEKRNAG